MYSLTDTIAYIYIFFTIPSVTKIPHRTCPLCKAPTVEEFDGTKCAQSIVHVSYKFYFFFLRFASMLYPSEDYSYFKTKRWADVSYLIPKVF